MIDWIPPVLIGGIIVGLVGVIYRNVLTKNEHAEICHRNNLEMKEFMKEQIKDLKEYLDVKIENVILKEIRKINGEGGN